MSNLIGPVGMTGGLFATRLNACETVLVAEGLGQARDPWPRTLADLPVLSAVASKFLAVATPRSLGLIGVGDLAEQVVSYQSAWATPKDIRLVGSPTASQAARGWRGVDIAHALAADICVIGEPDAFHALAGLDLPALVRRGTHLTVWSETLDAFAALLPFATLTVDRTPHARATSTLAQVVAGVVDGRVLDEITVLHLP